MPPEGREEGGVERVVGEVLAGRVVEGGVREEKAAAETGEAVARAPHHPPQPRPHPVDVAVLAERLQAAGDVRLRGDHHQCHRVIHGPAVTDHNVTTSSFRTRYLYHAIDLKIN